MRVGYIVSEILVFYMILTASTPLNIYCNMKTYCRFNDSLKVEGRIRVTYYKNDFYYQEKNKDTLTDGRWKY